MNYQVPIDSHYDQFIRAQVGAGLFSSAEAVILEGLRLVEQREKERQHLSQRIQAALADERRYTPEEVITSLRDYLAE